MGIWESIYSTTEAVKRNVPDPTPFKEVCKTSYGYCSAAVGKIDTAVRVDGIQRLNDLMPTKETRSRISLFASKFSHHAAKYALRNGYKLVPGGKIIGEIISETMNDVKSEKHRSKQEMEAMKEMIGGGKSSASKNLLDRVEMQSRVVELGYDQKAGFAIANANQSPEDVLRIFMMKEFMGNRFPDDLILNQIKHGNKGTSIDLS
ncbi:hypothetical protein ACH5RR_028021 [Cinchona calisaya]|uniref:Uncharacterized protein n=1 Tax=Cinchona calisaya TaxID=153742 RepID=A0ABD2YR55_9GENT